MAKWLKRNYRLNITSLVLVIVVISIFGLVRIFLSHAISGDVNGDGQVGIADLSILAANYGGPGIKTPAQGDLSGDGSVTIADLSILAANWGNSGGGQSTWMPPNTPPLSDAQAASQVVHKPENRTANATANNYVPTATEINSFRNAVGSSGQTALQTNSLLQYVTGKPGLATPSTDDLIQWTAHKWGLPEDWVRAVMVQESNWTQGSVGNRATVSTAWYNLYTATARVASTSDVNQSMGIAQIEWRPDGSRNPGTDPLRYKSTAFNLDYWAATVRYYYDGLCGGCTPGYASGQQWDSIGAWNNPSPWKGSAATAYETAVNNILGSKPWLGTGF